MAFSQEDKTVWYNSEVMREFEKIAQENDILNGPPAEAFLSIFNEEEPLKDSEEEETWGEEADLESAIGDAAEELTGSETEENLKIDLASLYMNNLLSNLQDLAHDLAEHGHIKVARKIEVTINTIKDGGSR